MADHIELNTEGGQGLSTAEAERRREQYGYNEIKDRSKKWPELLWNQVYGDHWYPNNIPAMMWLAIIVSLAIEDWIDAGVVMALHGFNSFLGFYETLKAGDAVAALKSALAPQSNVLRDGQWRKIPARELVPGDLVILKIGDVAPADGTLCEGGTMDLDQSGLTGESMPVKKVPGDTVYSGTVIKRGEQEMVVTHTGEMTEMGKGVALIQSVESKGQVEVIMNKITLFLLIFALVFNIVLVIVEVNDDSVTLVCTKEFHSNGCETNKVRKILSNLVVLVIATIPIATPVVVTATMAIGARRMAQQQAVVTRLSSIEELAGMTVLCSDKTGTLTKNVLTIDDPHLINSPSFDDLVFNAALGAKAVDPDAIDKCVREAVKNPAALNDYTELDFLPFDPVAKRTEATVRGPDGKVFKVSKGAPQVMVKMTHNASEIEAEVKQAMEDFAGRGLRPVGVCKTDEQDRWVFLGLISLFDPPRDDTQYVIEQALKLGSSVKMVTGDHVLIAKETCRRLGMGQQILTTTALDTPHQRLLEMVETVDGFAEVFPEHKFDIVALYQENGHITGMTGDGVNDAPALRKANVGFAVEGATPAAQGAAAVILLSPGLSCIIIAIQRSRKIFQRLQNYLIYRVFLSVFLLVFFFLAIIWARLQFPPPIIIVMCVVFDLATMSLAYDKVFPSPMPNKWDLWKVFMVAITLASIAIAGGLIFLAFMRDDVVGLSTYQRGMDVPCSYGESFQDGSGCKAVIYDGFTSTAEVIDNCDVKTGKFYGNAPFVKAGIATSGQPCCPTNVCIPNTSSCIDGFQYLNRGVLCPRVDEYFNSADTKKVPNDFSLHEGSDNRWDPRQHPYSQAVENTALFLVLSLIAQLAVFLSRVDGLFFSRRPGYVLLAIMLFEMIATIIVVGTLRNYQFWDANVGSSALYIRMTKIHGKYIGVGILYSLIVAVLMEIGKNTVYKVMQLTNDKAIRKAKRIKEMEQHRRRLTMADTEKRRNTMADAHQREQVRSRLRTGTAGKKGGPEITQPLLGAETGESTY